MNNNNTTNVPERLITKADIKVGDVLVFRPLQDLKTLEKVKCLMYGWDDRMSVLLDKEYVVTEEMLQYSGERIDRVEIGDWTYTVGISMLKFKSDESAEGDQEMEEKVDYDPSIVVKEHDPAIIQEMKDLVDKKRLKILLSISASERNNVQMVSNEMVDKYLDLWAHAKYNYYLLFGKNLRIKKEVEVEMNNSEMKTKIVDLCERFPLYSLILENFDADEYMDNAIKYDHKITKYTRDIYKIGMKLSKFLSTFIGNSELDIEVSKVMQDKTAKHNVYVSIDPYDYLTMSLNAHSWESCHNITGGCYGTGPLSYLLDEATLMAYRENGKEYDYNCFNLKFKGNSKSWRQCVYVDPRTCSMIFGRQYPNTIETIAKAIRIELEDTVAAYTNAPQNMWKVLTESMDACYDDESDLHYSDVENGYPYKFVKLKCVDTQGDFHVGADAPCLLCGAEGETSSGPTGVCDDCRDEHGFENS